MEKLSLELNPYRTLSLNREGGKMLIYGEKFEFAAMHKLWNEKFSEQENYEKFGKCANPAGHGHNYIVQVNVRIPDADVPTGWIAGFQKAVEEHFLCRVDHKNLNEEVDKFCVENPTVENIASFAWNCLDGNLGKIRLEEVTVWENDRTFCTFRPE